MQRRHFLALIGSPVVLATLQACGDSDEGSAIDGGGGGAGSLVRAAVPRRTAALSEADGAVAALNEFAARAYGLLADTEDPNLVFSPASIAIALAMTREGAVGATGTEMDGALGYVAAGVDPERIASSMNALTAALESRSGTFDVEGEQVEVALAIANSLWGQEGVTWGEDFLGTLAGEYGAGMRIVDYMADPESARRTINKWVAEETSDRIPELLVQGDVTGDLRLTLVNAVYMKAPWLSPFPEAATAEADFTALDGSVRRVPMMRSSETIPYARSRDWEAVEIPYAGGELAMLVVVPAEGSFAEVEAGIGEGLLGEAVAGLAASQVNLSLPRFDIESRAEMTEVMNALGMNLAFQPGAADFSGMTAEEELFVGFIIHQANITVDEKGTEAAAATAVGMRATSIPGVPVDLVVDRPFIFAVRDTVTGAVVFMGRIGAPA